MIWNFDAHTVDSSYHQGRCEVECKQNKDNVKVTEQQWITTRTLLTGSYTHTLTHTHTHTHTFLHIILHVAMYMNTHTHTVRLCHFLM